MLTVTITMLMLTLTIVRTLQKRKKQRTNWQRRVGSGLPTLNWTFWDGILLAIENVKTDVTVCVEQVNRTEIHISTAEDSLTALQAKVHKTKTSKKRRWRLDEDSWTRDSLTCPKVLGGGGVAGTFLQNWLPEALNLIPQRGRWWEPTGSVRRIHQTPRNQELLSWNSPPTGIEYVW